MDQDKRRKETEGQFAEEVLRLAQETFIPMYKKVHERLFNNSIISLLHKPEYSISFEEKIAEYYIPTVISPEGRLCFHRVVFKVFDRLERERVKDEVNALKERIHEPPGQVDSETIFLIAHKIGARRCVRGFRHNALTRGFLTAVVAAENAKVVWARVLSVLRKFWSQRLRRLCERIGLESGMVEQAEQYFNRENCNRKNFNRDISIKVLSITDTSIKVSDTLQVILDNMQSTLRYFMDMEHITLLEAHLTTPERTHASYHIGEDQLVPDGQAASNPEKGRKLKGGGWRIGSD